MNKSDDRPTIHSAKLNIDTKEIEAFQNETLRPIIKQLHLLLLEHFSVLLYTKKSKYFKTSENEKADYIHSIFQKENRYKSELKGMIIGNLSFQEYRRYAKSSRLFDKRINSIVEERILTNQNKLQDFSK